MSDMPYIAAIGRIGAFRNNLSISKHQDCMGVDCGVDLRFSEELRQMA